MSGFHTLTPMPRLLPLLLLLAGAARAQNAPVWNWEGSVRAFSGGTESAFQGGSDLGGFSYAGAVYELDKRTVLNPSVNLMTGARFERISLRHSPSVAVPDHLQSVAGRFGAEWLLSRKSWMFVEARPGFYGDDDLVANDFNAPVAASYHRLILPGFRVFGGLSVDRFRYSLPVAPFLGAIVRASPRWNLQLALPRLRAEYRAKWTPEEVVDLFAGLALDGGTYRVSPELGRKRSRHGVGGQVLFFESRRVETGVRYLRGGVTAELAFGWEIARRLEYKRPGLQYDGDGAPYLGLSLAGRF